MLTSHYRKQPKETETMIKIHKNVGELISSDEFCKEVAKELGQTSDMIHACFDIMEDELGGVEAMELYAQTVGITVY